MSTMYIQEPPTSGKVLIVTSKGDIDIELWCKEAPKACRNFIQLCMEGYYNNTIFHRVIKGFIIQGGDPTGTGNGGESIYGAPFKDEFHQRLKFSHRGVVGCASAAPNDNTSQFFITLDRADELTNKHTVFGKITGNTIFNVIAIGEVPTLEGDRPEEPPRIIRTEVLNSFFEDISPRQMTHTRDDDAKKTGKQDSRKVSATKNFNLISFGDEAEEEEIADSSVKIGKMKSQYDAAVEEKRKKGDLVGEDEPVEKKARAEDVRERVDEGTSLEKDRQSTLRAPSHLHKETEAVPKPSRKKRDEDEEDEEMNDAEYDAMMRAKLEQKRGVREEKKSSAVHDKSASKPKEPKALDMRSREEKLEDLRKEEEKLKRELRGESASSNDGEDKPHSGKKGKKLTDAAAFLSAQRDKYAASMIPKKKESREEQTLALLNKFKSKLQAQSAVPSSSSPTDTSAKQPAAEDEDDDGWMAHNLVDNTLDFSRGIDPALDPKTLDLHDPRNPLNIRKRQDTKREGGDRKNRNGRE